MTKREFFDQVEDQWDQYEHGLIEWEALVERLLGVSEQYRKDNPVTSGGVTVSDNAGKWADGMGK